MRSRRQQFEDQAKLLLGILVEQFNAPEVFLVEQVAGCEVVHCLCEITFVLRGYQVQHFVCKEYGVFIPLGFKGTLHGGPE